MRPITQRLSAAGFGAWLPLDQYDTNSNVGLAVVLSSNKNLTYTVDYTYDNVLQQTVPTALTRSTTTATATIANHGLSVNDYIGIRSAGAPFDGDYAVASVVDQNNVTFTVANSGPTAAALGFFAVIARVFNHIVLAGLTASADSNFSTAVAACRLRISSYTAGYADLIVRQGGLR